MTAMPKYFRDFNIENRAAKELDLNKIKQSPRHPSTVDIFKKREGIFYLFFFKQSVFFKMLI